MITNIKITGFKSFYDFEMEFSPLTVVAGANASGKSNLFDAFKLLSRLTETELRIAFQEQRGRPEELFTKYDDETSGTHMKFEVEMLLNKNVKDNWGGEADLKYTRLKYNLEIERRLDENGLEELFVNSENLENIKHNDDKWLIRHIFLKDRENWRPKVKVGRRGTPYISTEIIEGTTTISISQDMTKGNKRRFPAERAKQTVLSTIDSVDFRHAFAVKEEILSWKFLQLNPEDLRKPTRQEPGMSYTISETGKNLAAALYRISRNDSYILKEVGRKINSFLPEFTDIEIVDEESNQQFLIKLKTEDNRHFSSRVLSEGTLRLMALCILLFDDEHTTCLCFEEPENGIHPQRIKEMVGLLKELSINFSNENENLRQVIVNTHSPVIINALLQFNSNPNISIWFSEMRTLITSIAGRKRKMNRTKITPVLKSDNNELTISFSEQDRKLSLAKVSKYLETLDENLLVSEENF